MATVYGVSALFSNISQGKDSPKAKSQSENKGETPALSEVQKNAAYQIANCGNEYLDGSKDIEEAYHALIKDPNSTKCKPSLSFTTPGQTMLALGQMLQVYEQLGLELVSDPDYRVTEKDKKQGLVFLETAVQRGSRSARVHLNYLALHNLNNSERVDYLFSVLEQEGFELTERLLLFQTLDWFLKDLDEEKALEEGGLEGFSRSSGGVSWYYAAYATERVRDFGKHYRISDNKRYQKLMESKDREDLEYGLRSAQRDRDSINYLLGIIDQSQRDGKVAETFIDFYDGNEYDIEGFQGAFIWADQEVQMRAIKILDKIDRPLLEAELKKAEDRISEFQTLLDNL